MRNLFSVRLYDKTYNLVGSERNFANELAACLIKEDLSVLPIRSDSISPKGYILQVVELPGDDRLLSYLRDKFEPDFIIEHGDIHYGVRDITFDATSDFNPKSSDFKVKVGSWMFNCKENEI